MTIKIPGIAKLTKPIYPTGYVRPITELAMAAPQDRDSFRQGIVELEFEGRVVLVEHR